MYYITVRDTDIFAVNRSKEALCGDSLIYRDGKGIYHHIEFDTCAKNYKAEHPESSGNCIGDRNICEHCFILYTSGIKTKIIFKRRFVWNTFFRFHLLTGSKYGRFHMLQSLILESKYTTFDLS